MAQTKKQTKKQKIKAINQRLLDFEKRGLSDSYEYKQYYNLFKKLKIKTTQKGRISTKYINKIKKADLDKILNKGSAGTIIQNTKKAKGLNTQDAKKYIIQKGKLKEKIEESADLWYQLQNSINEDIAQEGQYLTNMLLSGKTRHLEYGEIWSHINKLEEML